MTVFIIAEIGINHNGDIDICKRLIDESVAAGCDAVKFQKRNIDLVYTQDFLNSDRESPWGKKQRDQKNGLEFNKEDYEEIDLYCKNKKIEWFASAWDLESQSFLSMFNCKYNKIASAMIVFEDLLNKVSQEKKHTFISTGMATMIDIEKAVKIFRNNDCPFELMHTVSTYPMEDKNANLNVINTLKKEFSCNVGYSGHEFRLGTTVAAVYLGATILERHITLDRTMWGSDHLASVEPQGLIKLVRGVRELESAYGDGRKRVTEGELPIRKKLRGC